MNDAKPRRGFPETPLVGAVGTGCQPVPGHILHFGVCVNPGSRLAAGIYQAGIYQAGICEAGICEAKGRRWQTVSYIDERRKASQGLCGE